MARRHAQLEFRIRADVGHLAERLLFGKPLQIVMVDGVRADGGQRMRGDRAELVPGHQRLAARPLEVDADRSRQLAHDMALVFLAARPCVR